MKLLKIKNHLWVIKNTGLILVKVDGKNLCHSKTWIRTRLASLDLGHTTPHKSKKSNLVKMEFSGQLKDALSSKKQIRLQVPVNTCNRDRSRIQLPNKSSKDRRQCSSQRLKEASLRYQINKTKNQKKLLSKLCNMTQSTTRLAKIWKRDQSKATTLYCLKCPQKDILGLVH